MATLLLRPNGIGALSEMTAVGATDNWDCVNEVTADNDTTYAELTATGQRDFYTIDTSALPYNAVISSVVVTRVMRATVTGNHSFAGGLRINGIIYWASTGSSNYTNFNWITQNGPTWTTNPATGQRWTVAALKGDFQIGHRLITIPGNVRTTQVYLTVQYVLRTLPIQSFGPLP